MVSCIPNRLSGMLIFLSKGPISRIVLCPPAGLALKSLQALCLEFDSFILDYVNAEGEALLGICWDLKIKGYHQEDRTRLTTNSVLDEHIKWVSEQINHDDLTKLAILTWNFDASSQLPSEQLFHFLAHPHNEVDNLYPVLHTSYSNLIGNYSTDWQFKQEFTELLSFLKNRMEDEWNVIQKCMSLEQSTTTPYSLLYPLAVDTSSGFYISRHDCRRHTSSAGAISSQPQNDDSSRPAHSKQPDYSPSAKKENDKERVPASNRVEDQNPAAIGAEEAQDTKRRHRIFLQSETHLTTNDQLHNEVRGIYASLAMVEERCIGYQQSELPSTLSQDQWQALISLHRLLLHKHNDFFLASQHPSASVALKKLSERYAMPARMWRHGIHSFLEFLRHRLPDSSEHILTFLHLAYTMMTLLLESVPAFKNTWFECLGDLARYSMAVNPPERETWAGVARYWYLQVSDRNPNVGRIQHHLAVLARPDVVRQLFHYTKSLVSVRPFPSAGESILFLFDPLLNGSGLYGQPVAASAFVAAHGCLFTQRPISDLKVHVQECLSHLKEYINQLGAAFKIYGAYMALCNFAAIFQYGSMDAVLPSKFEGDFPQRQQQEDGEQEGVSSNLIYYGSCLAFETFCVILDQIGNENVYPAVHVYLAFIWRMVLNKNMENINLVVPWSKIATFLNRMIHSDIDFGVIEGDEFPITQDRKNMPEDFLICGQVWSRCYFPVNFFKDAMTEDDGRSIEVPPLRASRTHRCLWLGHQLAKVCFISFIFTKDNH